MRQILCQVEEIELYFARKRYLIDGLSKHFPYLFPILRDHFETFNQKITKN